MIARAIVAAVPFKWVAADTVYGVGDIEQQLRQAGKGYVLGVSSAHVFRSRGKRRSVFGTAADIASTRRPSDWKRLSAGDGTKGPRLHDWCYLELADLDAGQFNSANDGLWTRGLRIRGRIADDDLAFFTTWCPAGTAIETLVSVEGHRGRSRTVLRPPRTSSASITTRADPGMVTTKPRHKITRWGCRAVKANLAGIGVFLFFHRVSRDLTILITDMTHIIKVIGAGLAIYAIYLPVALWVGGNYIPLPKPDGAAVEQLLKIEHVHRFAYRVQTHTLGGYADLDVNDQHSPVIVYEDMIPLGPGRSTRINVEQIGRGHFYHATVEARPNDWRYVTFSTSDNSDPRKNGRYYWAVLPK